MKGSIRWKLFALMSGLIIFYVLVSWLLNNRLLEPFYFYNQKNSLLESYYQINRDYKGDLNEMSLELEKLERTRGLHIIITDPSYNIRYDTLRLKWLQSRRRNRPTSINRSFLEAFQSKLEKVKKGRKIIEVVKDYRINSDFVILLARLDQGDYLFLRSPVAAIRQSVAIASHFFMITGLLTVVIGALFVFLLTGRFTRPILVMNAIAQRMAKLDFSSKYPVRTQDEIGELGTSLNSLSEQLEQVIGELKAANDKLREDIEKERKIDEMRKEFVSSVSHELKTPLALIQGYAEGLKVNVNEDEANKNFYCDVIMDETAKMNRLVGQILNLSQLESGYIHPEPEEFEIVRLVETVLKKNQLVFKDKEIELIFRKEANPSVRADYYLTEQVLANFLSNAVNHVDGRKMIEVTVSEQAGKVRIAVFNTGQPIPPESMAKIWNSFYKVDKARTRAYGGTGLGLSIVKAIQEAQGSGYGAANVQGGVEFWFEVDSEKKV